MNKSSHVLLGRLLCRHLADECGVFLDTEGFLIGSVLPDIRISFLTRPHFLKNHRKSMVRRIDTILMYGRQSSAYFGRSLSTELGILCHYYADFLCYAHSDAYRGDLHDHLRYEKALHRYLAGRTSDAAGEAAVSVPEDGLTPEEIFGLFLERHERYERMAPSFETDITQSLAACTEALALLTSACLAEQPQPLDAELLFPA